MGNKSSTEMVSEIENTLSKSTVNDIRAKCVQSTTGKNEITIKNSTVSGLNVDMQNDIQNNCFISQTLNHLSETNSDADLAQSIMEQQMDSSLLGGNKSTSEVYNSIKNRIDITEITRVYATCLQKTDFVNKLAIEGSNVTDTKITLLNKQFNDCLIEAFVDLASKNGLSSEVESALEKTQKNEAKISLFGNVWIWILLAVIVSVYLFYKFACKIPGPHMILCKFLGAYKKKPEQLRQ